MPGPGSYTPGPGNLPPPNQNPLPYPNPYYPSPNTPGGPTGPPPGGWGNPDYQWDPFSKQWVYVGRYTPTQPTTNTGGGGPRPTAAPASSVSTVTQALARFFAPDFTRFLETGEKGPGSPDPAQGLMGTLFGNALKRNIGDWQTRMRALGIQAPDSTAPILGLPGHGLAYGYIDPAWKNDFLTTTTISPVAQALVKRRKREQKPATPQPVWPPKPAPGPNHPNNPNSPNYNPGWKDM